MKCDTCGKNILVVMHKTQFANDGKVSVEYKPNNEIQPLAQLIPHDPEKLEKEGFHPEDRFDVICVQCVKQRDRAALEQLGKSK